MLHALILRPWTATTAIRLLQCSSCPVSCHPMMIHYCLFDALAGYLLLHPLAVDLTVFLSMLLFLSATCDLIDH